MQKCKRVYLLAVVLGVFVCFIRVWWDGRMADDLEMADVLLIKEIQYLDEYRHFLDDPSYGPEVGSNMIINFHDGGIIIKEGMDIAVYRLEADHMTLSDLISGYKKLSLIGKLKYHAVYERYKQYEEKYEFVIEGLKEVLEPEQNNLQ